LISFLVLMVLLFVGLAQSHSISPTLGYGIAVPPAVVTFVLAIVRYNHRKGGGEQLYPSPASEKPIGLSGPCQKRIACGSTS